MTGARSARWGIRVAAGFSAGAILAMVAALFVTVCIPGEPSRRIVAGSIVCVPVWVFALWVVTASRRSERGLLLVIGLIVLLGVPTALSIALR